MKTFITLSLLIISTTFFAQEYNLKNGFIADGYDVVSYFTNKKPLEGKKKYQTTIDGVKFQFSSEKNLQLFKANPKKYIPQFGGFCAYAVAAKNIKKDVDPESYDIRDGKLYLFYNAWFSNKKENWLEEDTSKLQKKGEQNWMELKEKKN